MVTALLPAAWGRNTGVRARAASESPHPEPVPHASEPPHHCHLSLPTLPAATTCTSAASSPFPAPLQTVQSVHIPPGGGDQGCSRLCEDLTHQRPAMTVRMTVTSRSPTASSLQPGSPIDASGMQCCPEGLHPSAQLSPGTSLLSPLASLKMQLRK